MLSYLQDGFVGLMIYYQLTWLLEKKEYRFKRNNLSYISRYTKFLVLFFYFVL